MRSFNSKWAVCAVALALCVLTASAEAQQQGGRRGGGRGGFGRGGFGGGPAASLMLLQFEPVQKELEIVDDQKEQIRKLAEDSQAKRQEMFAGFGDLSGDERREKMQEMRPKMEELDKDLSKKVEEALMPNQRDRLKQISIQVQGVAALNDEAVAKELDITADQERKLEQVQDDSREKMREAFQGGGDGDREAARARMETLRKETEEKTLAVLTSTQKEKFEKLKGEKFEFDRAELFRGQGGPGGGRGFGGGGGGGRRGGGAGGGGNN